MSGASTVRLPGVMAAAAALATACTATDVPQRLHQKNVPVVFHSSHYGLLPTDSLACPASSFSSLGKAFYSTSAAIEISPGNTNVSFSSSLSLAEGSSSITSPSCTPVRFRLPYVGRLAASPFSQCVARRSSPLCPDFLFSFQQLSIKPFSILPSAQLKPFGAPFLPSHMASFFSSIAHQSGVWVTSNCSLHTWHTPFPGSFNLLHEAESKIPLSRKPSTTVVLLGWLGAQQKHLKKYADWYNSRGIHAVTFVIPMGDVLNISGSGKAEQHVEQLTDHLATWLSDVGTGEKSLIFHTFSNTGWLTYGLLLEKLSLKGNHFVDQIKGCVVDSAPAADPDPQIWASGFSAALLKKRSSSLGTVIEPGTGESESGQKQSHVTETALMAMLEGFFSLFLQIPIVHQRLQNVVTILSTQQPPCPQLYIYSSADRVIPFQRVEVFIEKQRKEGRNVSSCNLQTSPHVDHFRSFPELYASQITKFLYECTGTRD